MERHRRIAALWNWLPAFRGVAEFESVHKAAIDLAVSPSALSRSVRLLEDAVGRPLFLREGAGLKLTPFGQELFLATKEALRRIDDATSSGEVGAAHQVTIGASSPVLLSVADATCLAVLRADPGARMRTRLLPEEEGVGELLRGGVDLLLGLRAERHAELVSEPLGEAQYAAFHLGAGGKKLDTATRPLVSVAGQGPALERSALEVSSVGSAVDAVRALDGYCILPDLGLPCLEGLARTRQDGTLDTFHATWRKPVAEAIHGLDRFVSAMRALLTAQ
jgi:DNA-binding transcriptional LysR family regulator